MSINRFSHVDVRVRSLDAALEFYKKFLPELGFVYRGGQMFRVFTGEGERPGRPWFGFTEDRNHVPNTNLCQHRTDERTRSDDHPRLTPDNIFKPHKLIRFRAKGFNNAAQLIETIKRHVRTIG